MSKRYFSAESDHGSATSYGFANDTTVLVFDSKAARDRYVDESRNLSCRAIRFDEVTKFASNMNLTQNRMSGPRPFSGEFWAVESVEYDKWYEGIDGLVGRVTTACDDDDSMVIERLYR